VIQAGTMDCQSTRFHSRLDAAAADMEGIIENLSWLAGQTPFTTLSPHECMKVSASFGVGNFIRHKAGVESDTQSERLTSSACALAEVMGKLNGVLRAKDPDENGSKVTIVRPCIQGLESSASSSSSLSSTESVVSEPSDPHEFLERPKTTPASSLPVLHGLGLTVRRKSVHDLPSIAEGMTIEVCKMESSQNEPCSPKRRFTNAWGSNRTAGLLSVTPKNIEASMNRKFALLLGRSKPKLDVSRFRTVG